MKLFKEDEIFITERPTTLPEIHKEKVCREVCQTIISNGWAYTDSIEDIIEDIKEVNWNQDAYYIAKDLEDCYQFNIDASFVMYLDGVDNKFRRSLELIVKEWVVANKITPKYEIGQKLELTKYILHLNIGDKYNINTCNLENGTYGIGREKIISRTLSFEEVESKFKI